MSVMTWHVPSVSVRRLSREGRQRPPANGRSLTLPTATALPLLRAAAASGSAYRPSGLRVGRDRQVRRHAAGSAAGVQAGRPLGAASRARTSALRPWYHHSGPQSHPPACIPPLQGRFPCCTQTACAPRLPTLLRCGARESAAGWRLPGRRPPHPEHRYVPAFAPSKQPFLPRARSSSSGPATPRSKLTEN